METRPTAVGPLEQSVVDAAIRELIVKSGYNVVSIARTGAAA